MRKTIIILTALFSSMQAFCGNIGLENWMARLDDSTPITRLSIPGTHDTGTGNGFTEEWKEWSKTYATTQDCSLAEQWMSGIRAFDLRPAVVQNRGRHLHVFHGRMKTELSYEDAILSLVAFVTENPSEFAFVVMRHEDDGDGRNINWASTMNTFLNKKGVKEHIADYSPGLTVKDVRGKIIVLSRKHYAEQPVGGYIEDWTSEEDLDEQRGATVWSKAGRGRLYVQDYYDTCGENMAVKIANIERMLSLSMSQPDNAATLVINHTSGYSEEEEVDGAGVATTKGYRDNASHTNLCVINYLKKHKGPTGLVMMDFAGVDKSGGYKVLGQKLTEKIIQQNFRK